MRTTALRGILAIALGCIAVPVFPAPPQFTEVAESAGVAVAYDSLAIEHYYYGGGGAVGDFDNDGWPDLFVLSGGRGGQPDWLFINQHDGTFVDRAAEWGVAAVHRGKGVAVGDFNKDGHLDLFVSSSGPIQEAAPGHHRLYLNNGNGTFADIADRAGVNVTNPDREDGWGAAFGDYDLDGDLDLFVAGFGADNIGSRLFRNDGDEKFVDVTAAIGFWDETSISVAAFAPRFLDMNRDRYPELLLVGDFGTSRYFRNNRDGTFTDLTARTGTARESDGMGQAVGDFNGDLLMDWYVTSIIAGTSGNKLYLNLGNHRYHEASFALGVFDGGYGWAAVAQDFNNDGLLDLVETNGGFESHLDVPTRLWIQNPTGRFDDVAEDSGLVHRGDGRGMASFDYDNDGDQDLVIFAFRERVRLFRNDTSGDGTHWLRVRLQPGALPVAPDGLGAGIFVTAGGKTQVRYVTNGDNFLSQSELVTHFGLGTAGLVERLSVHWPDGSITTRTDVAVDQLLTLVPDLETDCSDGIDNNGNGLTDCDEPNCCGKTGCTNGEGICCLVAADCDDGLHCNGREECLESTCVSGADPCPDKSCDESTDSCVSCLTDDVCSNGIFCDGAERCVEQVCVPGDDPCPGDVCDEATETCATCFVDTDCDNGNDCDGIESCVGNECVTVPDPCPGRYCDLRSGMCLGSVQPQPRAGQPLWGLSPSQRERFDAGRIAFDLARSADTGLGPVYNADRCSGCHDPEAGGGGVEEVTRFGRLVDDIFDPLTSLGGPVYQALAVSPECAEELPAEAAVLDVRLPSSILGAGLVGAIADPTLEANETVRAGRAHRVATLEDPGSARVGRYGWKAQEATPLSIVAHELHDQLGLTSRFLTTDPAPGGDAARAAACDTTADPEDLPGGGSEWVDALADFLTFLAPPPQTPLSGMSGELQFVTNGCAECHRTLLQTADDPDVPEPLRARTLKPYSDFLLHPMGDNGERTGQGDALPGEVRTAPLWGIRNRERLWHDGRISGGTFAERILGAVALHDSPGSAAASSAAMLLVQSQTIRNQLIAFLDSLGRAEFDHDGDGRIDLTDFAGFNACYRRTSVSPNDACAVSDIDRDMDVDIDDYVMFLAVFEGAFGGAVPNGADEPGIPLTLVKSGTGRITLSWGPSCATDDTDYALYEGTLGDFDSHFRKSCSTGGLTTATITPGTGNRYFLVVPGNGISEGSYGVDGSGNERPAAPAALACRPSYPSVCF